MISSSPIKLSKKYVHISICKSALLLLYSVLKEGKIKVILVILSVPSSLISLNLCFSDVLSSDDQNDNNSHEDD